MDIEILSGLSGRNRRLWAALLAEAGLTPDENTDSTVLVWDADTLAATGSRKDNLLKCIAVAKDHQGQGLTATVLTALRQDALAAGHNHLFLYTKPKNEAQFSDLFFYPIAATEDVLLMENRPDGIGSFLQSLPAPHTQGRIGAAVMHCNPFTKGHRYLIETAAKECDHVYIFVLSQSGGRFSPADRMEMVRRGTAHLNNVTVLPTGPYLISSATFPTYFLKDRDRAETVHCLLDIEIFTRYFAPKFGITHRYVGTEPLSVMTNQYNQALSQKLPEKGIVLRTVDRLTLDAQPISATTVRAILDRGDPETAAPYLPDTTIQYILSMEGKS